MSVQPTFTEVRAVVERVVGANRAVPGADAHTRLVHDYWLDSVELLEVIVECEREFGIRFHESADFGNGHFDTLGSLLHLVLDKWTAKQTSA